MMVNHGLTQKVLGPSKILNASEIILSHTNYINKVLPVVLFLVGAGAFKITSCT